MVLFPGLCFENIGRVEENHGDLNSLHPGGR